MPVVLGVVEPAVVEVAAEVVGACSVAVVGAAFAVGVDGVVLNEQQTKLLDKKILNCLPKIKKINSQKILPTGVTVFEPAALSGGEIWKKQFILTKFSTIYKKDNITTLQLGNGVTYSYVSVHRDFFFSAEVAFSV